MIKEQMINKLKKESRQMQQEISAITEQKKALHDEITKRRINSLRDVDGVSPHRLPTNQPTLRLPCQG